MATFFQKFTEELITTAPLLSSFKIINQAFENGEKKKKRKNIANTLQMYYTNKIHILSESISCKVIYCNEFSLAKVQPVAILNLATAGFQEPSYRSIDVWRQGTVLLEREG